MVQIVFQEEGGEEEALQQFVGRWEMLAQNIYVIRDYLSDSGVRLMKALWHSTPQKTMNLDLWTQVSRIPPWEGAFKELVIRAVEECRILLPGAKLTTPNLSRWPAGHEGMLPHYDIGSDQEFPERDWSIVLFGDDDFIGGECIYDDFILRPEKGMLVLFKGGTEVRHGVAPIGVGGSDRYTLTFWLVLPENREQRNILEI